MANGCPNTRRYLTIAAWFLLLIEVKIALGQSFCSTPPVTLYANRNFQFAWTTNYPNKYPANACCHWEIRASRGLKIRFKAEYSFIEAPPNPRCNGDYAEVFEKNVSLWKFCGSEEPEVVSTGNVMHVIFVSDNVVETKGMNFSYKAGSQFLMPAMTTTDTPTKKEKETNKMALFAAMGGAVLCSILFVTVLCVCLHTKRCGCPCGSRNTAQVVEPFENSQREHPSVRRTSSIFTPHLNRSVGSLPTDEVISLRVLSPPPYIPGPPPSIDSPSNSSSPPPPYSFNDPHPGAGQSDSLPSYPGEVSRY